MNRWAQIKQPREAVVPDQMNNPAIHGVYPEADIAILVAIEKK